MNNNVYKLWNFQIKLVENNLFNRLLNLKISSNYFKCKPKIKIKNKKLFFCIVLFKSIV